MSNLAFAREFDPIPHRGRMWRVNGTAKKMVLRVDPFATSNAVLSRWAPVELHKQRIVQTLAASVDRTVRTGPWPEHRCRRSGACEPGIRRAAIHRGLKSLCVYFGISIEHDVAGGHAVLREARRICDEVARHLSRNFTSDARRPMAAVEAAVAAAPAMSRMRTARRLRAVARAPALRRRHRRWPTRRRGATCAAGTGSPLSRSCRRWPSGRRSSSAPFPRPR